MLGDHSGGSPGFAPLGRQLPRLFLFAEGHHHWGLGGWLRRELHGWYLDPGQGRAVLDAIYKGIFDIFLIFLDQCKPEIYLQADRLDD